MQTTWWVKDFDVHVVWDATSIEGEPGDVVTLLPVGGPATGVTTEGLRWELRSDTLEPGSTHGVSNELVGHRAVVGIAGGVLLAIHGGSP